MFLNRVVRFIETGIFIWQQQIRPKLPLLSLVESIGLLIAGLSLWGFAAITEEVLEKETEVLDRTILQALYSLHTPLLNQMMIGITFVGNPSFLVIVSVGFAIFLLIKRQWLSAVTLTITSLGAVGLSFWLKELFARNRPELWQQVVDVRYASFPSAHAMVSLVIYGWISYVLATRFPQFQNLIYLITILLILAIGFSRLYLGVHWPTDVIAGYAAGTVWLLTCILSQNLVQKRFYRV